MKNGALAAEDASGKRRTAARALTCAASVARGVLEEAEPGGHHEVPEIHHGDADGHGGDRVQQGLPPHQETAVVSPAKSRNVHGVPTCARSFLLLI